MKDFDIPVLPVSLEKNTDQILSDYDVSGIELEYPWPKYEPRTLFTVAFMAAGTDGLGVSFCTEVPHNKVTAVHTASKSSVFEDDCIELFIMPTMTSGQSDAPVRKHALSAGKIDADVTACNTGTSSIQPAGLSTYYGFELNPNGALLDYRAYPGINAPESWGLDAGSELTRATIAAKPVLFDYAYNTGATVRTEIEDEFWYTELFIPWAALGRTAPPAASEIWTGTINRIDITGTARRAGSKKSAPHAGYQTLVSGTDWAQFHQPDHFARFTFTLS